MTQAEWLAATDPVKMLVAVLALGKATPRKLRLFACACCRCVEHLLTDERSRRAIDVAERLADGQATEEERLTAERDAFAVLASYRATLRGDQVPDPATAAAEAAASTTVPGTDSSLAAPGLLRVIGLSTALALEQTTQIALLRDLFGNPFRPAAPLAASVLTWHDSTVVQLAQAAYDERRLPRGRLDTARLAVLADALEEAGHSDGHLLDHLRGPGPHVRGCFALDAVLGRR